MVEAHICGITPESVSDGPGVRAVVFFQGCPHGCPGCHNPQSWDPAGGESKTIAEVIAAMRISPLLSGVTLSGGEPFAQPEAATEIAVAARRRGLNVWVFTGYLWEDLLASDSQVGYGELIAQADVIVDGPYRAAQRDLSLAYRGSANQRLIAVQESLREGRVVLWGKSTSET